uniref:Brix domain-containing protein n=1 Tax=Steinernema glaseri TaxID=37863 RepID=A0A1I7YDG4_9BILA
MNSKVGQRLTSVLKYLFPVPKPNSSRIMTFDNKDDIISFRHHTWKKGEHGEVELTEVGPRFEMKPFKILRGTLDNVEAAETEWALRPYMNSAGKKAQLSKALDLEE